MSEQKHGGARPGAGRPKKLPDQIRTTIYITDTEREALRSYGKGKFSEGIRVLLRVAEDRG